MRPRSTSCPHVAGCCWAQDLPIVVLRELDESLLFQKGQCFCLRSYFTDVDASLAIDVALHPQSLESLAGKGPDLRLRTRAWMLHRDPRGSPVPACKKKQER